MNSNIDEENAVNSSEVIPLRTRKKRKTITMEMIRNIRKSFNKGNAAKVISEDESLCLPSIYVVIDKICQGKNDGEIYGSKKGVKKNISNAKSKLSQILLSRDGQKPGNSENRFSVFDFETNRRKPVFGFDLSNSNK